MRARTHARAYAHEHIHTPAIEQYIFIKYHSNGIAICKFDKKCAVDKSRVKKCQKYIEKNILEKTSNLTKFINRIQVDFKVKRKESTIIMDKLLWPILKCTIKSNKQ